MRRLACLPLFCLFACTPQGDPMLEAGGLHDNFDRQALGPLWRNTGGAYELRQGRLHTQASRNRPLWLQRRLPRNVRIEVDACALTAEGDLKLELFGDGHSKATEDSYTATSYVVIFGGWGNALNVIARLDEHGVDRVVGPRRPVLAERVYRLRIERQGNAISAWADDALLGRMVDARPLQGRGHDHFAFNNWQAPVWFDNLRITPL